MCYAGILKSNAVSHIAIMVSPDTQSQYKQAKADTVIKKNT